MAYITEQDRAPKPVAPAKAKTSKSSLGSMGVFTVVAHRTSWTVALLGTASGVASIIGGILNGDGLLFLIGISLLAGSWISACGLGTLAEISIKLSKLGDD